MINGLELNTNTPHAQLRTRNLEIQIASVGCVRDRVLVGMLCQDLPNVSRRGHWTKQAGAQGTSVISYSGVRACRERGNLSGERRKELCRVSRAGEP